MPTAGAISPCASSGRAGSERASRLPGAIRSAASARQRRRWLRRAWRRSVPDEPSSGRQAGGPAPASQRGQASVLMLGLVAAVIAGALILAAFGQAFGTRSVAQRAADLSAVAAAQTMRDDYPRLFEPAFLGPGVPNPNHLSRDAYLAAARAAAVRGARQNGVPVTASDVSFPGGASFAPTRVTVRVRDRAEVHVTQQGGTRGIPVRPHPPAELSPTGGGMAAMASGGGYSGPLAYRQGKPMRPDVAQAFDRMEHAAAAAGVHLIVNSG